MLKNWTMLWTMTTLNRKAQHKNKLFGQLWSFLDPLMLMGVYTVLVVLIFQRDDPQFPVLLFSVILAWRWFVYALNKAATIIQDNKGIVTTTAIPKGVLTLSCVLDGFLDYLAGLLILVPLLFIFQASFSVHMLWLPLLLIIQLILTVGLALLFTVVGVYLVDIRNMLQFSLRLWFYLSPALYAVAIIPDHFRNYYMIFNPFAPLFESYKNVLIRGQLPSDYIGITLLMSIAVFIFGYKIFNRYQYGLVKAL